MTGEYVVLHKPKEAKVAFSQEDKERMDSAGVEALEALDKALEGTTKDVLAGVMLVIMWLITWKGKAGYKRMCRGLIGKKGEVITRLSTHSHTYLAHEFARGRGYV